MLKPDTSQFYRCIRRSNAHRAISEKWSDVRTDLCDREMPCGTHRANDKTVVRNPDRSLRRSSQKAGIEQTWCQSWQNLSLDQLNDGNAVATSSAQCTTSVRCEQSSENTGKLIDWSMETRQSCRKPCRYRKPRNLPLRNQGVRAVKRAGMATKARRLVAKAVVSRERTRNRAISECCSNRNSSLATIWLKPLKQLQ